MKILMLVSECMPFVKTGGLADAVPALAVALSKRGHDVSILMPRYYSVDKGMLKQYKEPLGVPMGNEELWCGVYQTQIPGSSVKVWMLDREDLFGRRGIYGPDGSSSWPDNARRYAFLALAAFQLSRYLRSIPDILHLHDWQAAPAAWLLKYFEGSRGFSNTASVLTVHNLGYQGVFPLGDTLVFPKEAILDGMGNLCRGEQMNYLAAGIHSAHAISTVSPTYAKEILRDEYSHGLGDILETRSDCITGILNGMDYNDWNPKKDKALKPYQYNHRSLAKKSRLKARLQEKAGLPVFSHIPLFGMITRLTGQKGLDLMEYPHSLPLEEFREGRAQFVLLGTGEKRYEEAFKYLAKTYPRSCSVKIDFSDSYSKLIEAGSDFFLMPSRYEPCGLNQMYSLAYGTLPVVRRTGGLADTVIDIDSQPKSGNGFVFDEPTEADFAAAIKRASRFYRNSKAMQRVRKRAMKLRFDWVSSAIEYEKMFQKALEQVLA